MIEEERKKKKVVIELKIALYLSDLIPSNKSKTLGSLCRKGLNEKRSFKLLDLFLLKMGKNFN